MHSVQNDVARPALPNDRVPAPSSALSHSPAPSAVSGPQRSDLSQSRQSAFRGPTSTAFTLDVANTTISNMGYKNADVADDHDHPHPHGDILAPILPSNNDPLLDFDKDEMVRLCRLHEDEIGIMYPVLDIQDVVAHAKNMASFLDSLRQQRSSESINDLKTLQLKMVICCALVVEGHGHSEKAQRLYDSMEAVINRKLMADPSDQSNLPLLALLAGYRFLSNDEVLAWRVIGQVNRLCIELGIHRKAAWMSIPNDSDRRNALMSFWSAYVLDRRWAFGTGLPYTIQDADIDPDLPMPVSTNEATFEETC